MATSVACSEVMDPSTMTGCGHALAALVERGSLDHLICPTQHGRRDSQPECLGGFQVDDQLELGRLLDGQIGRLGALEDPVHEDRGASLQVKIVCAIDDESAGFPVLPYPTYRRQPRLHREVCDLLLLIPKDGVGKDHECT